MANAAITPVTEAASYVAPGTTQTFRDSLVWGKAATVGFLPVFSGSFIQIPFQIGMFIFFTLILIFLFKVPWYISIPASYILQGLITMLIAERFADLVLTVVGWQSH